MALNIILSSREKSIFRYADVHMQHDILDGQAEASKVKTIHRGRQEYNNNNFVNKRCRIGITGIHIPGCILKFPDWPSGARTANSTALCH
jgi:hypothetical protein